MLFDDDLELLYVSRSNQQVIDRVRAPWAWGNGAIPTSPHWHSAATVPTPCLSSLGLHSARDQLMLWFMSSVSRETYLAAYHPHTRGKPTLVRPVERNDCCELANTYLESLTGTCLCTIVMHVALIYVCCCCWSRAGAGICRCSKCIVKEGRQMSDHLGPESSRRQLGRTCKMRSDPLRYISRVGSGLWAFSHATCCIWTGTGSTNLQGCSAHDSSSWSTLTSSSGRQCMLS